MYDAYLQCQSDRRLTIDLCLGGIGRTQKRASQFDVKLGMEINLRPCIQITDFYKLFSPRSASPIIQHALSQLCGDDKSPICVAGCAKTCLSLSPYPGQLSMLPGSRLPGPRQPPLLEPPADLIARPTQLFVPPGSLPTAYQEKQQSSGVCSKFHSFT